MIKATVKTSKSSLKGLDQTTVNRFVKRAGVETINHIRTRTEKGLDVNNNSFEKYADSTIKMKKKNGASTKVNLKDRSVMLRSLTYGAITNGIKVYLNNRQSIGSYHQYGDGNLPKREWFGLNKITENKIISDIFSVLRIKFTK